LAALAAVPSAVPYLGNGVTTAILVLTTLLMAVFGAMLGASAVIAFYLPIAPFIIWFGVLLGWLVMVIEAIFMAPVWVLAHIHPDGDDLVGRGGAGYSLVLSLMVRPMLSILGLLAALVVMDPVVGLFVSVFWSAFDISQNQSYGPFIWAASLVIFAMTLMGIVNRILALIHVIPDEGMKWMGGASSNLGSYAGDLSQASTGSAAKMGGALGGAAGGLTGALQGSKQIAAQKDSANQQRAGNAADAHSRMMARKEKNEEAAGATDGAYRAHGLSEGKGVGLANSKANFGYADKMSQAAKDLSSDSRYQALQANGDEDGMLAMTEARATEIANDEGAAAAAKSGGSFTPYKSMDQFKEATQEAAYSAWHGANQDVLPPDTAPTYAAATAKFEQAVTTNPTPPKGGGSGEATG
jgi:hypothetical protein